MVVYIYIQYAICHLWLSTYIHGYYGSLHIYVHYCVAIQESSMVVYIYIQ